MKKDDKRVKEAFKAHNVKRLFVTADGLPFFTLSNAKAHATTLADHQVKEVLKDGKSEAIESSIDNPKGSQGKAGADPEEVTSEQLRESLTIDFTIKEKLAIATEFGIEEKDVKGLKDDELSLKLIELSSESQRELLVQKTAEKLDK